jgi:hypothetical protein
MEIIISSTNAKYFPTRKLNTHLPSSKQQAATSWLVFAPRKAWETVAIINMLNLLIITAGRLVICGKVDMENNLMLALSKEKRWNV